MRLLKLTLVIFLLAAPLARGEIYRWYDNGIPQYGDRPPVGVEAERIRQAAPPPADARVPKGPASSIRSFLDHRTEQRNQARAQSKTATNANTGAASRGDSRGSPGNGKRHREESILSLTERKEAYRHRNDPQEDESEDAEEESERSDRVSKPKTLAQKKADRVKKRREAAAD